MYDIVVGYDIESECVAEITMDVSVNLHGAVVGASGSGKSIALLYLIYQILSLDIPVSISICDAKNSGDFAGIVPPDHYASGMIDSVKMINKFYEIFQNTPENNDKLQFLIIDEYAGLITSLPDIIGGKEGRAVAETTKSKVASLLMLSRSKKMSIISVMQRFSTTLYTASSGAGDNYHWILNMGKLHTQTHISLFANERLEDEKFASTYKPSCGSGYFWQAGESYIKAIRIPLIRDKAALTRLLQHKARNKFGNF